MAIVAASVMTSCEENGTNTLPPVEDFRVDVALNITCENEGCSSATQFTNENIYSAPGAWYYDGNNWSVVNMYDNNLFDFTAHFQVEGMTEIVGVMMLEVHLEMFKGEPFELNKKYDINDIVESMTDEAPKKVGAIKIMNSYIPEYVYNATSGWIMFTERRYSEEYDVYFTDVEFECEVVDSQTGEVILKAERGSMKNMYNTQDRYNR